MDRYGAEDADIERWKSGDRFGIMSHDESVWNEMCPRCGGRCEYGASLNGETEQWSCLDPVCDALLDVPVEVMPDHIHLFIGATPTDTPLYFMGRR